MAENGPEIDLAQPPKCRGTFFILALHTSSKHLPTDNQNNITRATETTSRGQSKQHPADTRNRLPRTIKTTSRRHPKPLATGTAKKRAGLPDAGACPWRFSEDTCRRPLRQQPDCLQLHKKDAGGPIWRRLHLPFLFQFSQTIISVP